MATLVFTAIGTALGGPIGGAIGALTGRQIDAAIFAPKSREGPRLSELSVSSSSYGHALPRLHGRCRVPGQVIWATDLVETKTKSGNGKGRPSTVSYSYSASFAVALSSSPIIGLGRIWADGKLLRGAAGDLKTGGSVRIHHGRGDQAADPLIAAAEGSAACPAWRGTAYVVFEDLQLADFGNRIPTLSFEVFASVGNLLVADLLGPGLADCDAGFTLDGLDGIAIDSSPAEVLAMLDPVYPLDCDACGATITIRPERSQAQPIMLPEAAVSSGEGQFGAQSGFERKRGLAGDPAIGVLRHYDPDRDYQPGAQRAIARANRAGQPRVLDLPATLGAPAARLLVEQAARRNSWAKQILLWRVSQLDPALRPGSLATVPGHAGHWRVRAWEWRAEGVELELERLAPALGSTDQPTDPGRVGSNPDLPVPPTRLVGFELPWDGNPATPVPAIYAAVGSSGPGWAGAALFVDHGDGALLPLGPSGRTAAGLGTATAALPPASPLLIDRANVAVVQLHDPAITLLDASSEQLAQGSNRALLGDELIQFGKAEPLGNGIWRLSCLWRGRGGTECAVGAHQVGEPFVMLDAELVRLDANQLGDAAGNTIAALGLTDPEPITSAIRLAGIGWRPLPPVHGSAHARPDGGLTLGWCRRARGNWLWGEGAETPIGEQREAYLVEFPAGNAAIARWEVSSPGLDISATERATLFNQFPQAGFAVRQLGDRASSLPLTILP